jgi:hypothetical protein
MPATEDSTSTAPVVLPVPLRNSHIRSPACPPALVLSVPMNPSESVVTRVSTEMTLMPAARARSMAEFRAEEELAAITSPSTPREIEFSTSWTCSSMLVSEVGPKVETPRPKSSPACLAPANMTCQNEESLALMITSIRLPAEVPPDPPPPTTSPAPVARPARTPRTPATSAIAATSDREKTVRFLAISPGVYSSGPALIAKRLTKTKGF